MVFNHSSSQDALVKNLTFIFIFLFSFAAFAQEKKQICVVKTANSQHGYMASLEDCIKNGQDHAGRDSGAKKKASVYHSDLGMEKKISVILETNGKITIKVESSSDMVLSEDDVNN